MAALVRGGRLLLTPFVRLGVAYNEAAKRNPSSVGIATTVIKTSLADAFAQLVVERNSELDVKRNAMFCAFGFGYLGVWQYYLYAKLFPRWTPHITKVVGASMTAPVLVFIDQCIHHPLLYFPSFYLLRGYMQGREVASSLSKCMAEMPENLRHLWTIWVPAQLVNFSVVPVHLRVPYVAGVSFLWCIVLSVLRGAMEPHKVEEVEEQPHNSISSGSGSSSSHDLGAHAHKGALTHPLPDEQATVLA